MNSWYGVLQAYYQLCKIYEYESLFIFHQFNSKTVIKATKQIKNKKVQVFKRSRGLSQGHAGAAADVSGASVSACGGPVRPECSYSEADSQDFLHIHSSKPTSFLIVIVFCNN